jgi:periplasmic copper chaperone A
VKRAVLALAGILIVSILTACGAQSGEGIQVVDAWVRPAPMAGGTGAAYMQISNEGPGDDTLIGVRANFAESAEMHETVQQDGMATMHLVDSIALPAGGSITFEPGGYHVMLINIAEPMQPGESVTLTLVFEQMGEMQISAEVRAE